MKLFDVFYEEDFGHDLYVIFGQFNNSNLLESELHTTRFWSWEPDINFSLGLFNGALLSLRIDLWSFSFSGKIFSYRAPMDLVHTRQLWK